MTDYAPDPDRCLVCRTRTPRAGYTCEACLTRMRRQLDDLPAYYALAAGELGITSGVGNGRGNEIPLGINVAALDVRLAGDVLAILGSWAKLFREDLGLLDWLELRDYDVHDRVGVTLVELVAFLQRHLARVAESHPAIDEFAAELADLHRQAQAGARAAPRQAWVVSCPLDDPDTDTGRCGAGVRVTGEDFGGHVRCRRCGTTWDVTRLLHIVASDAASVVWLPAEEVALLYGVSERSLQRWAKDGTVRREHGRYDLDSVRSWLLAPTREGTCGT